MTLSNGLRPPAGSQVYAVWYAISKDPESVPNPDESDGFQNFGYRQQPGEEMSISLP